MRLLLRVQRLLLGLSSSKQASNAPCITTTHTWFCPRSMVPHARVPLSLNHCASPTHSLTTPVSTLLRETSFFPFWEHVASVPDDQGRPFPGVRAPGASVANHT